MCAAFLSECYEEDALMMSEGLDVITGLLMGLNVLDYTVMLAGEEFDRPVRIVHNPTY